MPAIPVIICIRVLNADPRRPSVSKRRRLGFDAPVPMVMISDERRLFSGLVVGGREHLGSTRYKFVERRQAHPDIIGIGRSRCGNGDGRSGRTQRGHAQSIRRGELMLLMWVMVRDGRETAELLCVSTVGRVLMVLHLTKVQPGFARVGAG